MAAIARIGEVAPSFTDIILDGEDVLVHIEQLASEAKIVRKSAQGADAVAS